MRARTLLAAAGAVALFACLAPGDLAAGDDRNPNGYGLYSPADGKRRIYRYDPRSWYYRQRAHYPFYASGYWVPRADMRYRYRYQYYGPRYRYFPAWGYPRADYNGPGDSHFAR